MDTILNVGKKQTLTCIIINFAGLDSISDCFGKCNRLRVLLSVHSDEYDGLEPIIPPPMAPA